MIIKDHNKKNDFVLMKSLVLFYGQVSKALRSISHMLVSFLAFLLSIHKQTAFKLLYDVFTLL